MNYDQLLHHLNNTPIKINAKLMRISLKNYNDTITKAKEYIYDKMVSKEIKIDNNYLSEKSVVNYCNQFLVWRYDKNKPYLLNNNEKFHPTTLQEHFPSESFVSAYIAYRECLSLKKRYEAILKHEKNGYIQPTFAINSAGSIYTSKPALPLRHQSLANYFDCNSHYFKTLDKAMEAIENAKEDSQIITVLKTTVYYRNSNYEQEKEQIKQAFLKEIEEGINDPIILFFLEDHEFDLEYYGLSHLLINNS